MEQENQNQNIIEALWEKSNKTWEGLEEKIDEMKEKTMGLGGRMADKVKEAVNGLKESGEKFPNSAKELYEKIKDNLK